MSIETLFQNEELTTREKILEASIDLISRKGFDAVSVREIAREVGIRESSIYNHFKSKDEILDTIIDYFIRELTRGSQPAMDSDEQLLALGPKKFMQYGSRAYMQYINTPRIGKIWRIISIEVYRNERIRMFFQETILTMPLVAWEQLFGRMIALKLIRPLDPKVLAREFFAFAIYLMFIQFILKYDIDSYLFTEETLRELDEHVDFFMSAIEVR